MYLESAREVNIPHKESLGTQPVDDPKVPEGINPHKESLGTQPVDEPVQGGYSPHPLDSARRV